MDVSVNKEELLKVLEYNRDIHVKEVTLMKTKYTEKLKALLAETLENLKDKEAEKVFKSDLIFPVNYQGEYDRVIRKLKSHTEVNITLDDYEYTKFMDDEWSFTPQHLGATRGGYGIDLKNGLRGD